MKTIFVDEIIKDAVDFISGDLLQCLRAENNGITGVHFQQGHPIEIIQRLTELSQAPSAKANRYPLVALFRDFPETKGTQPGIYCEATVNIIIATRTEKEYTTDTRKEKSFRPILYPIYNAFMQRLVECGSFMHTGRELQHTKIDHYFWGRESVYGSEANIFNDWIDCIEIKDLRLKVIYNEDCI